MSPDTDGLLCRCSWETPRTGLLLVLDIFREAQRKTEMGKYGNHELKEERESPFQKVNVINQMAADTSLPLGQGPTHL